MRPALAPVLVAACSVGIGGCRNWPSTPSEGRVVTEDVERFWAVMDEAGPDDRVALLRGEYIEAGSRGVQGFIPMRIISAEHLDGVIETNRERYGEALRARTDRLEEMRPKIIEAYRRVEALYPPAVYPPVYFVVGGLNTGGTTSNDGLIIGVEVAMRSDRYADDIPRLVVHELTHFQQNYPSIDSLLDKAIHEGSADFFASLVLGSEPTKEAWAFGEANEREVWERFTAVMHEPWTSDAVDGWVYGGSPHPGWPTDLAYYVGYKICDAYYDHAEEKAQAIDDIMNIRDFDAFFRKSGYGERFGG